MVAEYKSCSSVGYPQNVGCLTRTKFFRSEPLRLTEKLNPEYYTIYNRLLFMVMPLAAEMKMLSCAFNMDTTCVELKFANGSMISIDTTVVESEVADNLYQHSEIDCLTYNDPVVYADLILNGDPEAYLKAVTEDASLSQTRSRKIVILKYYKNLF